MNCIKSDGGAFGIGTSGLMCWSTTDFGVVMSLAVSEMSSRGTPESGMSSVARVEQVVLEWDIVNGRV